MKTQRPSMHSTRSMLSRAAPPLLQAYLASDTEGSDEDAEAQHAQQGGGSGDEAEAAARERYRRLLLGAGGEVAQERKGRKDWGAEVSVVWCLEGLDVLPWGWRGVGVGGAQEREGARTGARRWGGVGCWCMCRLE